jgi:hypothetical protein
MSQFAEDLDHDLQKIRKDVAEHAHATESYFEGVLAQAEVLKQKVQGAFDTVSTEAMVSSLFTLMNITN